MCIVRNHPGGSKPVAMEIPPKPEVLPVISENIPAELTALDHWVLSRATWKAKGQKWDKPPLQISGRPARANDPHTWVSFKVAYFHYRLKKFDYLGYVPTEADGLVFLDLDCVVNPDGTLGTWSTELRSHFSGDVPEPSELVARLGSYAELSPSGSGIRIICRGSLPEGRRKIGGKGNGCPDGLEMYAHAHYLTITGQRLPEAPATVTDCTEKLVALHAAVFGKAEAKLTTIPGPLPVTFLDDLAVIEKASHSKGGDRFLRLWNGDASDYPSRSEADFALVGKLAFWCGPNPAQIERLMRQSGLVRPKWDRRHYLAKTVTNCLKDRTEFYTGCSKIPCSSIAAALQNGDSCVQEESTVRNNRHTTTQLQPKCNPSARCPEKLEWRIPRRIRDKYDSNPWECEKARGVAGQAEGSPVLICATCRKRSCPVCAQYWRLKTFDRFGFHLHNHDGQLYADTIPDFDWKSTLEDMRRRAKKLGVPFCFVSIRDDSDNLTVLASVPIRAEVAKPVELPEALELLETAIDQAAEGPRPVNACRAWSRLPDKKEVRRVAGGCSPSAFRATLLAWKAQAVGSERFIMCDRPGLFFNSEGHLDVQLQCDFWREAETRDYAGEAAADETRERLAAAREQRTRGGPTIDPLNCFHDYHERPDPARPGWLKTSCPNCGKVFGSRPEKK